MLEDADGIKPEKEISALFAVHEISCPVNQERIHHQLKRKSRHDTQEFKHNSHVKSRTHKFFGKKPRLMTTETQCARLYVGFVRDI
ncbi:MAG TPA: hypothetical protein VN414_08285 [Methanosarcina sp.]|nr:hypothetical protein [Methanosarcina sp.]